MHERRILHVKVWSHTAQLHVLNDTTPNHIQDIQRFERIAP